MEMSQRRVAIMPIEKRVWKNEKALQLAILQELADVRILSPEAPGFRPKDLRNCLQLNRDRGLETPLRTLHERGYVDAAEGRFVITEVGLKYLAKLDEGWTDDWPPFSRVPRHPLPGSGADELVLPLPKSPSKEND